MSLQIHYRIAMPRPESHRFHVTIEVNGWRMDRSDLVLPVWTPGSYVVREFARHVENFQAETPDGASLTWHHQNKHTWQLETTGTETFQVHYEIYANELTVRTSHLDGSHGYFNGTNVFMYVDGFKELPVTLEIVAPEDWHSSIALPQNDDGYFEAETYDILADSPAEIGTHRLLRFEVAGKPHEVAIWGSGNEDEAQLVSDLKQIVETVSGLFGHELPYERYLFILHLGDRLGGGLEHRDSTTIAVDRWIFSPRSDYERFLRLALHEFFHTWNVKRIRPSNLGPFDYTREVYSPLLWVMEGFTTYYDLILLCRASLITPERCLEMLGDRIANYLQQPGRLIQSLEVSSLTAWIKFYRQDENYPNSGISYYLKGSLLALMLDLHIRAHTNNEKSLDDVMRYLWHNFGRRDTGFSPDDFLDTVEGVGELDLDPYLERYIRGVEELPLEETLLQAGLKLEQSHKKETPAAWPGIRLKAGRKGPVIKNVLRDTPGEQAGLMPDDRLIAIDGYELRDEKFLTARLKEMSPGDQVTFHLFRYGQLLEKQVTLGAAPPNRIRLHPVDDPTPLQQQIYETLLNTQWAGEEAQEKERVRTEVSL